MRIAMIHPSLWGRGGAERQLLRLAIELQKFGHEVEIFTDAVNEKCYPELLEKLTVNVIPHPLWRLHQSMNWSATSSMIRQVPTEKKASLFGKAMQKLVLKQYYAKELPMMINIGKNVPKGFDVINNHNFPSEWAAMIAKRKLKIPIVWMCNGPPSWFLSTSPRGKIGNLYWPLFELFDKTSVRYIDEIAVISQASAEDVKKAYGRPASIVRSGVDVEFFHRFSGEKFRKTHGLQNSLVMLQVGNIGLVRKNVDSVKILSYLSKQGYDHVKLVLDGYGSPEQINALKILAEKFGVKNNLIFSHAQTDTELAEVYAACDVFIYPSHLTWSLAVSEAMAAGKPAIVPKSCGISEIMQNGVNGIVTDGSSVEEIARQVELLINNPKLRRNIGGNAYDYVKNNLSWEKYARKMQKVFEQTIASSGR